MGKQAMRTFQREIAAMGYKYQFITLAGFHNLNFTTFDLARRYREDGMAAYSELQQAEFAAEAHGFTAIPPPKRGWNELLRRGGDGVERGCQFHHSHARIDRGASVLSKVEQATSPSLAARSI